MKQKVIFHILCVQVLSAVIGFGSASAKSELERRIDSLFVIASSGEVRFRDQNEPAMDSIAAFGAAAVPHLIEKFTTKSARERWTVIWILQRIGSEAVPDLVRALNRPEGLVVQRVCWALGDIKDTAAVAPLIRIHDHSRWQVRDQVITALGKMGDPRGVSTILEAFADTVGQVRKSAAVSTGQLRISVAVGHLVHQLGDEFYGARMTAAAALLSLDTADVISVVSDSMSSVNQLLGDRACWVLGQLGTDEAIEVLHDQLESDHPERRAQAGVAIITADPLDNCGFREGMLDREADRFVRMKIESAISAASNVER